MSKSGICINFTCSQVKKVPSKPGNQPVVIFLTLDAPTWLCSQDIVTPHHFEVYLVFSNEVRSYAFWGSLTPKLIVIISGWTVRDSVLLRVVFFCCCDHDSTGCITIMPVLQAVPYCASIFLGCCMIVFHDWVVLYCACIIVGCYVLVQVQFMVPWLGILAWPSMTLNNTCKM